MQEVTMEKVNQVRQESLEIVTSKTLTHEQKVASLAKQADALLDVLDLPEGLDELLNVPSADKVICDLFEGRAPLRPRYIIPDYEKFMREGSQFLQLAPPTNIWEATNALLIFYKHVPSVTNFPVFIGNLDQLLEPFIKDEAEAKQAIRLFLTHIDRTICDSFCHADIGPDMTKAGRLILEVEAELKNATPNLTLKYDPSITPDAFAYQAAKCCLEAAKPSFANHQMFQKELGPNYVIASCYNGLLTGGGAYTLVRMLLGNLAKRAENKADFFEKVLPHGLEIMAKYMDERVRFIVEESNFFESNFLAKEGFISRDKFTAMYGVVGLADCVNLLLEKEGIKGRFGHDEVADKLGVEVIEAIAAFNAQHENHYCFNNHFLLHAQVGTDLDENSTPGCRIPIGEEPENLLDHIKHCGLFHKYFPSGIGDIFPVDYTVHRNPEFIVDLVKGAFQSQVRYLSFYEKDSDVIRVTGYLVKRSEMAKLDQGENVLQDTTALGLGAAKKSHVLERKVR